MNPRVRRESPNLLWWVGALAVFVLVPVIFFLGMRLQRTRQARATIDRLGGIAYGRSMVPRSMSDPAFDYALANLNPVRWVYVSRTKLTPTEEAELLTALRNLPDVTTLRLVHTPVSQDFLQQLATFPKLEALDVGNTAVGDQELHDIVKVSRLDWLVLDRTSVTDTGMPTLLERPELVMVSLEGTAVTDAGLRELEGLPKLQRLYLAGSRVTKEAVDAFRKSHPYVRVMY
ncbi:MAG TPA: hypothetical protein VHB77_12045 [Planctomycetaceae bacterium]|nr:hypothetical protein [Planctomycetaceae bacterium]